eukprot:symbB.v1.2.027393.t2/scaffold2682.1/size73113/3
MPPKGKAKAKGKAAAAPPSDDQVLDVPPPPPAAVCLPLPDSMLSRCATERCLLLCWADSKAAYKVQVRQWIPGDPTDRATSADDWRDAKEMERVRMPGRGFHEGRLYAFEQIRVQYRMVLASGPKPLENFSVANWHSVPSEPVATFVDPPIGLQAELNCDNDVVPATVNLTWKSSNFESLRAGTGSSPSDLDSAFASWPGLMPNKVQVRWRVVRTLSSVDEALPRSLAAGNYTVSAALDNLVKDADFRIEDDTWYYTYKEALHGVIAVFSVRVGTAYKWSPWSEDSPPLVVEVHEPTPPGVARLLPLAELDRDEEIEALARSRDSDKEAKTAKCVEIRNLTDSDGEATWMPFTTEGLLTWVEYRVIVCLMEGADAVPQWDHGIVAGVVQIRDKVDKVSLPLRGLLPSQWYCVRVDARYPNVGKRAFSNSKALSPPFLTPFPSRPPLQPMPVRLDADEEVEDVAVEEDDSEEFRWSARPWVALRVEKGFFPEKYMLQYKDAAPGGEQTGKEHFDGWQEPVVVERFGKDKRNSEQWDILRIGLVAGAPEVVVLRMMTLTPKTSGPLQWSVASAPVVSSIAPPQLAEIGGQVMRLLPSTGGLRLSLRCFLQPGEVLKEGHLPHILQRAATTKESVGHRYVTQYQLRVRMKGETMKDLPAGVKGPRRYMELPATPLPAAHNVVGEVNMDVLGEPETPEEVETAGLLGYFGTRYELQVELSDPLWELLMGHDLLEASVRVGTEHRWSCWTPWSAAQGLQVPLPAPLQNCTATAEALGPTAIKVSWPPFDRVPGINSLEYVIRAEPLLAEDGSSGCPAETVICFKHEPRKQDGQIVATPQFQRLLDVKEMSNLKRLASCFEDIRKREGEEEKDTKLQVEMAGLLPWTSYLVSVSARYPAGAGLYPRTKLEGKSMNDGLGLMVETPGGQNTPTAPRQVSWQDFQHNLGEDAMFQADMRAVLLSIEDRPQYVLEYRACAPTWAHYDPEVGSALRDFQGSWPRKELEEGAWKRVPIVKQMGKGVGESYNSRFVAFTAPDEVKPSSHSGFSAWYSLGYNAISREPGPRGSFTTSTMIKDIGFITDLEGDIDTFWRYVDSNASVLTRENGVLKLKDSESAFVFGGDLFDRGPGDLRLARELIDLKKKYPARVFLLMGNRDINKMRLSLEDSKVNRLKWILRHTMGSPAAFEHRRHELILETPGASAGPVVSDAEVLGSFLQSVEPGGMVASYLQHAQIGVILGDTLFVHGAVEERALGFIPSPLTRYKLNSTSAWRREELLKLKGAQVVDDLHQWISALNHFAQLQVKDWLKGGKDMKDGRPGEALIAYQSRPAMALCTVVVSCYVDGKNMPSRKAIDEDQFEGFAKCSDPLSQKVVPFLHRGGVRRVVVGHKPSGEAPAMLRTSGVDGKGYEVISADTNYASTQD